MNVTDKENQFRVFRKLKKRLKLREHLNNRPTVAFLSLSLPLYKRVNGVISLEDQFRVFRKL